MGRKKISTKIISVLVASSNTLGFIFIFIFFFWRGVNTKAFKRKQESL